MRGLVPVLAAALLTAPAIAQPVRSVTISASEYPEDVRPSSREYRLRVRYELTAEGSVGSCRVTRSSRNASIDSASCRILLERALIRPGPSAVGLLEFGWLGEDSLAHGNARGAPIPLGFIDTIHYTDYPMEAIRRRESGALAYAVDVSARGLPLRCTVTSSSGSTALDGRTCELAMARAVFIPAVDTEGRRIPGTWRGRFRWQMP